MSKVYLTCIYKVSECLNMDKYMTICDGNPNWWTHVIGGTDDLGFRFRDWFDFIL